MVIGTGAAILGASALSGLFGLGSSVGGGFLSYNQQKKLQQHNAQLNYDYSIKSAKNMPSAAREGYESANYNPMLLVQNGVSGANASFSSTGSAPSYDIGAGVSTGIANAQSFQRLKNETLTAEATQDEAYANADKAKAEKNAMLERMPFIGAREKAEIMNLEKDSLLKESQIHNMDETTRFIEKRYELDRMLGLMGIDTQRRGQDISYNASTYGRDIELAKLKRYNVWAEKHPYFASMSETMERHPTLLQYGRDYLNYKRETGVYKKNRRKR